MFLLFSEISKVRSNLFQINGYVKEPLILPEGSGPPVIHSEKVYVPVKEHPDVSLVKKSKRHTDINPIILFVNKRFLSIEKKSNLTGYHLKSRMLCYHENAKQCLGGYFAPVFILMSHSILLWQ